MRVPVLLEYLLVMYCFTVPESLGFNYKILLIRNLTNFHGYVLGIAWGTCIVIIMIGFIMQGRAGLSCY